jgi:hypothetical protein
MKTRIRTEFTPAALAVLAACILLLSACPNPVTQTTFSQMTDKAAPIIDISSPASNSAYTQTVTVQGTVVDGGQLRSLTYTVTGTLGVLATGEVPLGSVGTNGSYSFQFGTITFSGPIAVTVSAKDWNDNVGTTVLTLTSPGTAISSFTATPSNKKVTLNWELIPGATSYTVYYTTNGTLPTESYGQTVTVSAPPYELASLKNGALHVFLLKAHTTAGTDYWSGFVQTIPLSEFTLAPMVTGDYRKIQLEWSEIEGVNQFEVYRSTDPAGTFVNHTGVITGNSFTDPDIPDNAWYYYKVRPALAGTPLSTFNGAQTVQIPGSEQDRIVSLATSGSPKKVKVSGNFAFVAAQSSGLLVVDILDPRNPHVVASVQTTNALDVDLNGGRAYVADGSGGLRVIDISTPTAPSLLGSITWTGANAREVSFSGGSTYYYAFVLDANGTTSMRVINVATPSSMSTVGTPHTIAGYEILDVATYSAGTYSLIYLPTRKTGTPDMNSGTLYEKFIYAPPDTIIYDLASYTYPNPGTPTNHYRAVQLVVSGSYVYAAATVAAFLEEPSQKFFVLSRYPSSLNLLGETTSLYGYSCNDIAVSGTKAFSATGKGVQVYDFATPTAPTIGDYWNTPGASEGVAVSGNFAYVASGALGFQVVDVVEPYSPTVVGTMTATTGQSYSGVTVRGSYAFVASSSPALLRIIDVHLPATPSQAGSVSQGSPVAVALSGNYAFVANGIQADGLSVVNVADPANPVPRGSVPLIYGTSQAIAIKGEYAYVAARNGLQIFDISNPDGPNPVGFYEAESSINGVALRGRYAFVADGAMFRNNSLKVVDVSNPTIPVLTGRSDFGITVTGVSLNGDYAFISDSMPNAGIYAVNINPSAGSYLSNYGPCDTKPGGGGSSEGIVAFGQRAYATDSSTGTGIAVVDILNPTSLVDAKRLTNVSWNASCTANQVVLSGKYLYVTDSNTFNINVGMKIIKLF